jgi:radical SAM family uncharacterized protein/radical SAM-linked protein
MRHIYADFIDKVAKPARYLGGEYQQVVKDPASVDLRMVLAFPDVYEIGMSHLGTKILYSLLNKQPRIAVERAFTPWVDMEAELRSRGLPLVSLESSTPLCDFDVIGISLQYELTFTNALTLLDLGGVPLRAEDRDERHPIVLGGGPTATHPEPVAPFFDAFFVGEGEEELPGLLRDLAALKRAGRGRLDALAELAARYPLYVPALYDTAVDEATGMVVVDRPRDARAPARVRRGLVRDIDSYPFPSDAPVAYAEAVFDRASVEIARGCTEGCRFCQAGMIYRPVRERDPASVVDSVLGGVARGGYDETSLTSLSTADYSCITPLVQRVARELRDRKVSLSVSSLRAYGLGEEILDEMATMNVSGLTFAPEAGTQRMRDVVNKNVTEAHVEQSAERVFARGWHRLKLYFMIGLPTEEDGDVLGIVETGQRMLEVGRRHVGRRAEVTVSVSSHVPKPHTPFQWCAQDSMAEIRRKQALLRGRVSERGLRLKHHDSGISFVEGVLARGDRRLAGAIELAWRRGARFDGWDELFDEQRWHAAFADCDIDVTACLGTRPVSARLPWDHIDVGLEEGFLLAEYRKALKSRLSPPCGKVAGQLIHATSVVEARAETGKLVCYDCGVACDLSKMRADRIDALTQLGATEPAAPRSEPVRANRAAGNRRPVVAFPDLPQQRYRLRYAKLGRAAYLGHLDMARVLARLFRRAEVPVAYTRGFNPKPSMQFGPALSLGVPSLGELFDVALESELAPAALVERLREVAPDGIDFTGAWQLTAGMPGLGKLIGAADYLVTPAPDGIRHDAARLRRIADAFLARSSAEVVRGERTIDVRGYVSQIAILEPDAAAPLRAALAWSAGPDRGGAGAAPESLLQVTVQVSSAGGVKPGELLSALGVGGGGVVGQSRGQVARLGFRDPAGRVLGAHLAPAQGVTTEYEQLAVEA